MMTRTRVAVAMGAGVLALAPHIQGATVTFDNLPAGAFVGSQYFLSDGLLIAAENNRPNGPDVATLFNSEDPNATQDEDLSRVQTGDDAYAFGWEPGNIPRNTVLNNLLIIAENVRDTSPDDGLIDRPDDEGDGGRLFFSFSTPINSFGFDLIDMQDDNALNGGVSFYNNGTLIDRIAFSEFTTNGGTYYDPTVQYGENTANRIRPITAASLGVGQFNAVVVDFATSSAMDTIVYTPIPEPAAAALLLGLPMMGLLRRRDPR